MVHGFLGMIGFAKEHRNTLVHRAAAQLHDARARQQIPRVNRLEAQAAIGQNGFSPKRGRPVRASARLVGGHRNGDFNPPVGRGEDVRLAGAQRSGAGHDEAGQQRGKMGCAKIYWLRIHRFGAVRV